VEEDRIHTSVLKRKMDGRMPASGVGSGRIEFTFQSPEN